MSVQRGVCIGGGVKELSTEVRDGDEQRRRVEERNRRRERATKKGKRRRDAGALQW